jgi:CRP-like cAMP-binding protein
LYESGGYPGRGYFPTTAMVSLLYMMENGQSAEMAVVGRDGVVGIALFMGGATVTNRAVVQIKGVAYRMRSQHLMQEFGLSGKFQHFQLRYTLTLLSRIGQTAVCNRHHSIDQQLCRWLLLSHDRMQSNDLVMTQELIANMLGVRREGVSEAAGNLQKGGLINYNRSHKPFLIDQDSKPVYVNVTRW